MMITLYILVAAALIGFFLAMPTLIHAWKLYRSDENVEGSRRILFIYIVRELLSGFPDVFWASVLFFPAALGFRIGEHPWLLYGLAGLYLFFRAWGAWAGRQQLRALVEYKE